MKHLLTQNSKMRASGKAQGVSLFNFGLPAIKTCPAAGKCKVGCYATQLTYNFPVVKAAYATRLKATKLPNFAAKMIHEISCKRGQVVVRIHDSGDFYSLAYLKAWVAVCHALPSVQFYAYTKQVKLCEAYRSAIPKNLTLIYSEGGLFDGLIPQGSRHSRVFGSLAELKAAGYDDVTEDDTVAYRSKSGKIGLVYHGYASTKWTTTT